MLTSDNQRGTIKNKNGAEVDSYLVNIDIIDHAKPQNLF